MKRPCTEEEQAILIHMLGHNYGDDWNKVFIHGVEAYVVKEDENHKTIHIIKSWPWSVPEMFIEEGGMFAMMSPVE